MIFFTSLELELDKQLKNQDSYSVEVFINTSVNTSNATYRESLAEQIMWQTKYGEDSIRYIRQPQISARLFSSKRPVSIIEYNIETLDDEELPKPLLLYQQPPAFSESTELSVDNVLITAYSGQLPQYISKIFSNKKILVLPSALATKALERGFITFISANLNSTDEVATFVSEVEAYYLAQGHQIRITSALGLLKEIERFKKMQQYLRLGIILSCGIIISIILGSIAILEFRQEAYLIALLKTFGAPRIALLAHTLMENILLVGIGVFSALKLSIILFYQLIALIPNANISMSSNSSTSEPDMIILLAASALGVLLAMIPVAIGLRKPAGLTLQ